MSTITMGLTVLGSLFIVVFLPVFLLYAVFQAIIFANDLSDENDVKKSYKKNYQGLLYLPDKPLWYKILLVSLVWRRNYLEKEVVRDKAVDDAGKNRYSNLYAKPKIQKLYDTVFKHHRKAMIKNNAKSDADAKRVVEYSISKAEQEMYQKEYLKHLMSSSNSEDILQQRFSNLYANEDADPIEFEQFKKFIEAS